MVITQIVRTLVVATNNSGSRNTPSCFILQKPEVSAGTDEPSGLPNYDWGRLYLPTNNSPSLYSELVFTLCYRPEFRVQQQKFRTR